MKKNKLTIITLADWEAEAFKAGVKTQMTVLAETPTPTQEPFISKKGTILYSKEHRIYLEVTEEVNVRPIGTFTDEDAINEGISSIYPHSNVGDDFFYLPDQIIAVSALECFKHYWNSQPGNAEYPFEKNPYVFTLGLKYK